MKKRQLNKHTREEIIEFLTVRIENTTDYSQRDKLYSELKEKVVTYLKEKYPPADMILLKKYEQAHVDRCIKFYDDYEYNTKTFDFPLTDYNNGDVPMVAGASGHCSSRRHHSKEVFEALDGLAGLTAAIREEQNRRISNFKAFIYNARYFHELTEVIPSLAENEGRFYTITNLPTIVSPDLMQSLLDDPANKVTENV